MNDMFAARVGLYSEWDRKLHSRTRFFGAATVTVETTLMGIMRGSFTVAPALRRPHKYSR